MKIIPTIGPITESDKSINFIKKNYEIIRLNGSHNTLNWHERISKKLNRKNKNLKLLLDVPGIKPRTCNETDIKITINQKIIFSYFELKNNINKKNNKENFLRVKLSNPIPSNKKNKFLSISDGEFNFKILKKTSNYVLTKSLQSFTLKPRKGVNFINSVYDDDLQIKKYLDFISNAKRKVLFDSIGLSFIQSKKVIKKIKKLVPNKTIVAKIENYQGILKVEEIVSCADCIMIDRGDLAAEIGVENLYESIIKIISIAKNYGKPVILATDNLISMNVRSNPTKSEVFALGFANDLKIDYIMLSDETATYSSWKKTLNWTRNFLKTNTNKKISNINDGYEMLWHFIKEIKGTPLVIFTKKGLSIPKSISMNSELKMIVFTESDYVKTMCTFYTNIISIKTNRFPKVNFNNFIDKTIFNNSNLIFKNQKEVFLLHISNPKTHSRANTLRLIKKKDFI